MVIIFIIVLILLVINIIISPDSLKQRTLYLNKHLKYKLSLFIKIQKAKIIFFKIHVIMKEKQNPQIHRCPLWWIIIIFVHTKNKTKNETGINPGD